MKVICTLTVIAFLAMACEPITERDQCSLESFFTSSWWEICT